jgi:hypothetical protein
MKTVAKNALPTHFVRPRDEHAKTIARRRQRRAARAQDAPPLQICNATSSKGYTGQELRPYTGRPGSLDFLACPSRTGASLHYRSEQCIQFQRSEPLA